MMDLTNINDFTNVTVIKKANIYFDGKVTSRKVVFPDGTYKTLGIMLPGEYEFSTVASELMEIQAGIMKVQLPGDAGFKSIDVGGGFSVPANSSFKLVVESVVDYICSYGV